MNHRLVSSLLCAAFLLTACAGRGGDGDAAISHPDGPSLVLSITDEGGFVPIEWTVRSLPSFVLLGDGRVIVQGPQILIFPAPILPSLQVRTLTESGIQTILEEIARTELFTDDLDLRGAAGIVADAPDTVFTLHADGREVTVRVYALGLLEPGMEAPGMSAAEVAAHQTLSRLRNSLLSLDTALPDDVWADAWQQLEPDALRLWIRDATEEPPNPDVPAAQAVRDWPVAVDPAAFGVEDPQFGNGTRCGVVEGEEAATWLADLATASEQTRWRDGDGRRWAVIVRPLLPHDERACPQRAPAS